MHTGTHAFMQNMCAMDVVLSVDGDLFVVASLTKQAPACAQRVTRATTLLHARSPPPASPQ